MKRFIIVLLSLLIAVSAQAQTNTLELMGLGMPAALATEIGNSIGDDEIVFTADPYEIRANTSDAADSKYITIAGGGAFAGSGSRGANCRINGNEASGGGDFQCDTGDASGSDILFDLNNAASSFAIRAGSTTFVSADQTEGIITAAGKYINSTAYVPTMAATPALGTNQVLPGINVVPTAAANTAAWLGASTPVPGQMFKIYNNSGAAVRIKGAGAALINGGTAGKYIEMAIASYMECVTLSTGIQQCPFYSVNGAVAAVPTPA